MGTAASSSMEEQSTHLPQLPAEIMYDILLLLPVKTLIRFKCACKSWYSLISSPQFQKHHFRRAQAKPPLLLTLRWDSDHYFTLGFTTYNKVEETLTFVNKLRIYGGMGGKPFMLSCRGLVCLASWGWSNPLLILNPSTQELISLPTTQEPNICVGFGCAASTEEFKVVRFFYMEGNCRCQVFTLGTTHWREVRSPPYRVDQSTAPFLHEALHFLSQVPSVGGVQETGYIGAFDLETEEYREGIPLPAYDYSLGHYDAHNILPLKNLLRLSVLGGSLCLTLDFGKLNRSLELWLLKDYRSANWVKGYVSANWVKGYVIDVYPVYPYPSFYFWAYPVDNTIDETILLNCSDEDGAKLVRYNPADGIVTLKDKECASTFYFGTFYTLSRQRYGGSSKYGSIQSSTHF